MTGVVCLGVLLLLLLHPLLLHASPPSLVIFAGAASKPASEEVAGLFTEKRRVQVRITFGGSGFVLSQMKLARMGDIYFPGSSDFMEKAKRERLVFSETEKIVAYLVPAMNVQRGNPRNIRVLQDLLRPGIRVGLADPETVCVGTYAVEAIERNFTPEEQSRLRKNLVTTVESCERAANIISLKAVDAVLGWRVFEHWDPKRIETVLLQAREVPRIGYIPAAVSAFARDRGLAEDFIRFLLSPQAQSVFRRYGYLTSEEEARRYTLPQTPVGGEYSLPRNWGRRGR
jgi:molybdate transport system substrate-binding protein